MKGGFTMTTNDFPLDQHIERMREICEKQISAMKSAGIGDETKYQQMRADNEALIKMDIELMSRKREVIKW